MNMDYYFLYVETKGLENKKSEILTNLLHL